MNRFVAEVLDKDDRLRKFLPEIHVGYMEIVNEELAPDALTLALAITELEDAFPEIADTRRRDDPPVTNRP